MKWSAKLGDFAGIKVYVHTTFLMLIAWVGFAYWRTERSADAAVAGILFTLALFACVLLHEFGHALTSETIWH
jgi:Zn-dependent protease